MPRYLFFIIFLISHAGNLLGQDTLVLKGQPDWNEEKIIFDYCFFYEEQNDEPLSFEEVKKHHFVFYDSSLRKQRLTNRPLVIQWLRFTISNSSLTERVNLWLAPNAHYFIRLYDSAGLKAKSGIYETSIKGMYKGLLPLQVQPQATKTFWLRTEDRQNQILPPHIGLQTIENVMKGSAEGRYNDRLLFLLLAVITGCLFFITVFAGYQYFLYRDTAFLWYMVYTASSTLTGFFWVDIRFTSDLFSSFFHDLIFSTFIHLMPVLYSLFIGKMLKLPQQFKKTWIVVKLLLIIATLQMLVAFITYRTGGFVWPDWYGHFVSIFPVLILNIILLVLTAFSKDKVKWFLFAGLISMFLLWSLPFTNLLHWNAAEIQWGDAWNMVTIFIPFFMLLGLCVEAIIFSFALSYRSKLVLIEKNILQKQYNVQLQEELQKRTTELNEQNKVVEEQKINQVQTVFEKKIAETEMTALRAQMNPHFIFNCLNSIKLYTLENDSQTASEYLTKFSQLIRLVLENSRSEKITLQKELETLKLYIELEAMRFKDKVKYQINVVPHIDQQYIEIPPLLLQPYVENAIWHGLMHKPEGGNISIDISQPEEFLLHIEISDDGIGREKAKEQKSKSATRQKSFGLKMTSERLNAINHIYQTNTEVKIVDMVDTEGNAAGTKVILEIPL